MASSVIGLLEKVKNESSVLAIFACFGTKNDVSYDTGETDIGRALRFAVVVDGKCNISLRKNGR